MFESLKGLADMTQRLKEASVRTQDSQQKGDGDELGGREKEREGEREVGREGGR
jgi:hypothetical protein